MDGDAAADLTLRHVLRPEARAIFPVDNLSPVARRVESFFIGENHRSPVGLVWMKLQLPPGELQSGRPVLRGQETPLGGYPPAQAIAPQDTEMRRNGQSLTAIRNTECLKEHKQRLCRY